MEKEMRDGETAGKGAADMAEEKAKAQPAEQEKKEEITIKFGKGLSEPFTAKDGKEFMRISIPNQDPADKSPWASFVLPAKAVHDNQFGKGLWAKIPVEGTTVVTKPTVVGHDKTGRNVWEDKKTPVPNKLLKEMVEAYKAKAPQVQEAPPRESAREKLDALKKDSVPKAVEDKPKAKAKAKKEPER